MSAPDPVDTQSLLLEWYRAGIADIRDLARPAGLDPATVFRGIEEAARKLLAENAPALLEAQYRQLGPLEPAACRSCGAAIVWIRTVNGKASPCDERRRAVTTADGRTVVGHESHFSTCAHAAQHRKKR
jgi:hypothetical protein